MIFWTPEIKVEEQVAFQLALTAPSSVSIASIPFSRVAIFFGEGTSPIYVEHEPSDKKEVHVVRLGHVIPTTDTRPVIKANLRWHKGDSIIFAGSLSSEVPKVLKVGYLFVVNKSTYLLRMLSQVTSVVLTIEENGWKIEIPCGPRVGRSAPGHVAKWLSSVDPPRFIQVLRENYHSTVYDFFILSRI